MTIEDESVHYYLPDASLLDHEMIPTTNSKLRKQSRQMAEIIQQILDTSKAKAKVVKTVIAPQLIQFIVRLEQGGRFDKITALEGKIKDALAIDSIDIVIAPIPGVFYVGIQVP